MVEMIGYALLGLCLILWNVVEDKDDDNVDA